MRWSGPLEVCADIAPDDKKKSTSQARLLKRPHGGLFRWSPRTMRCSGPKVVGSDGRSEPCVAATDRTSNNRKKYQRNSSRGCKPAPCKKGRQEVRPDGRREPCVAVTRERFVSLAAANYTLQWSPRGLFRRCF